MHFFSIPRKSENTKRSNPMKTIIVLCFSVLLLASCAHFPDDDVVIQVYGPSGAAMILMGKGYLDKENHGKNWIYKHEWDERVKGLK